MKQDPPPPDSSADPVYVIEKIPVAGEHGIARHEIELEGIPVPRHLRMYEELARGGMGRIHPATDRNLLRNVALKRLDRELSRVPMYKEGFIAEAQITGQLEHPNIVPVHELAVGDNGVPYFTMKLVQGVGFDQWLADPRRPAGSSERLQEGLEILLKVCDAVAYAHHRGVIHRDLKPSNIMVADFGQVYLMDWGLARLTRTRPASGARSQMEAPGAVGTPSYMAPEQARGNPAEMDERSDVFGLGAVLYEIVSGQVPYGYSHDQREILARACEGQVISIDVACARLGVSKPIRDVVRKAVAPDPAERYQSVLDLQRALRAFLREGLHLPRRLFAPGALIVQEGEHGKEAYMIVSGRCRAFRQVAQGRENLAVMGPGDVFGEMALLLDEPRAATVEALDEVTLLVLDKATMEDGLGAGGWTGALVRALAQRYRDLEWQVRRSGIPRG